MRALISVLLGLLLPLASCLAMSVGPKNIRVSTYNVLSSSLARADYFSFCNPKFLLPSYRLARVQEKLQAEVSKNAIICLQEVSTQWAGDFHKYFASRGYHFVTGLYGNKFNGYMGVGVAVPLSEYEILDADIARIADTKNMPRKSKTEENKLVSTIKNLFYWPLYRFFKALGVIPDKPKSAWEESLNRFNQMVSVRLRHKAEGATPFVVGTYHMPCIFKIPQVMMIHCALSAKHIHNYASGAPYVYCGDFNIKPDSIMYSLLTDGKVSQDAPEYPKPVEGDEDWKCQVAPLKSAYKEFLGKEPEYTNNARIVDQEPFIETLDYIFTSSQHPWKVLDVENLAQKHPPKAQVTEPLPSEHEPSDHVLLSAELSL